MSMKLKLPTVEGLTAEDGRLREEKRTVEGLLANREAERHALLLSGSDADVKSFDDATAALQLRLQRINAHIVATRRDYPAAQMRELEARKVTLRGKAEQDRKHGCAAYERFMAKVSDAMAELPAVFSADATIANFNANLPAGAPPLLPCEADYRWIAGIPDQTEIIPRKPPFDDMPPQVKTIVGRGAVQPEPIYSVLEIPALRAGEQPLRVPGTPLSMSGHAVKILKPAPDLPPDDQPSIVPADSAPAAADTSLVHIVHGFGR